MTLTETTCPRCGSKHHKRHMGYKTKENGTRTIYHCLDCGEYFSETAGTFLFGLRTPISTIIMALKMRSEGMSLNATCRIMEIAKNTLLDWERRLEPLKNVLLLYALLHKYIQMVIEGDELYTRVGQNTSPDESVGWTIVLMDRATRFLWELQCGRKDRKLFRKVLRKLVALIERTGDMTLLTDGERSYGNILFELCSEVLRTGRRGRPPRTLKKGIRACVKNKGSQGKKRGRKRKKYQAPWREHPDTEKKVDEKDIHANHCEAFNAALRRRNSTFRRRSNTYAKNESALQRTLNIYWAVHNFVRVHFTTKKVPAVALGIIDKALSWGDLFMIPMVS